MPSLTFSLRDKCLFCAIALLAACAPCQAADAPRTAPNVVLIMTDDQGYGDLACHGNTMIHTPNLDRLFAESARLTNFHVDPTCAPTRAALMTGRNSGRTGVWHTIMGRSLLRRDEYTLANAFADSGYRTGIFGKWHLGDNFPYRPQDRGFHEVLVHGGGGVGQTPDYWGNDYFDDTYFHNGQPQQVQGYCTDVWFDAAIDFISAQGDKPFFCYVPTNAPHSPYLVDEKYSRPYTERGVPAPMDKFYGMITNADENVGRLLARLEKLGLAENTLVIFMTDNGTAAGVAPPKKPGWAGFNAGMRGQKGSPFDGGHRVPCFLRWPGKIEAGRDLPQLTAHVDLLPTLVELCQLKPLPNVPRDGASLAPLLKGNAHDWPERTLVVDSQRIEQPRKWRQTAVMTDRWRLVDGQQLFDLLADPGQTQNVAAAHPEVVSRLSAHYDAWWQSVSARFEEVCPLVLGANEENPTWLTAHDWHADLNQIPWNQTMVRTRRGGNGYWAVDVAQAGRYEITLHRQPPHDPAPLNAQQARLKIGPVDQTQPLDPTATQVTFQVTLPAGPTQLQTWLGKTQGANFVQVRKEGEE